MIVPIIEKLIDCGFHNNVGNAAQAKVFQCFGYFLDAILLFFGWYVHFCVGLNQIVSSKSPAISPTPCIAPRRAMASPVDRFNAHTAKRAVGKLPHQRAARALATSVFVFIGVSVWLLSGIRIRVLRDDGRYVLEELPQLDGIGLFPARALTEEELGAVIMGDLDNVTNRE